MSIPLTDAEFFALAAEVEEYTKFAAPALHRGTAALLLAECARARANEQHLIARISRLTVPREEG